MASLNERLAEVIKRKRQRDRYTQADLGAKIGASGSYISAIEGGSTSPRISEIEALASAFRTTAFELISEAVAQDQYSFSQANRERDAFLNLYDSLTPEHQQQARTFLLFLRDLQGRSQ
jgi:Predicted transcriptional regulator with C-terminal CBS domains